MSELLQLCNISQQKKQKMAHNNHTTNVMLMTRQLNQFIYICASFAHRVHYRRFSRLFFELVHLFATEFRTIGWWALASNHKCVCCCFFYFCFMVRACRMQPLATILRIERVDTLVGRFSFRFGPQKIELQTYHNTLTSSSKSFSIFPFALNVNYERKCKKLCHLL